MKNKLAEIIYENIDKDDSYEEIINIVITECFKHEGLSKSKLYVSITLTDSETIRELNKIHRNIDKETDVLSFPIYERDEIALLRSNPNDYDEVLGDMVISIPQVKKQAVEYNHSFKRELSYMVVHSFYHLLGYDHMEENDKKEMRAKEDEILNKLNITRDN